MNHISADDVERFHLGRLLDAQAVTEIEQHISNVGIAPTVCWA